MASSPSLVPTARASDLPTFTIKVDGAQIASTYHVMAIRTLCEANRIGKARIVLLDGDVAEAEFPASDGSDFAPGRVIAVSMGYHGTEESVFEGKVTGQSVRIREDGPTLLVVECRDSAMTMTVGRRSAIFTDMKDSDVAAEIVASHGLTAEVAPTDVVHGELVQLRTTDWDFLVSRMDANGRFVVARNGTVTVVVPKLDSDPVLSLAFGSSILEFDGEIDARSQVAGAKSAAWDRASQARAEAEGADPGFATPGNLSSAELGAVLGRGLQLDHAGGLAEDELQAWADACLVKRSLARVRGRVRCQGFAALAPGDVVEITGVGERFAGKSLVSAVRHEFVDQDWKTDIQLGFPPDSFHRRTGVRQEPAAGLVAGAHGLEIGVVRQLEGDPEGEERILVQLPMIAPDEDGVWARLALPHAGASRGFVVRPEVGDEVVVGFLGGDPRHAVVLGSFHSSANASPFPPKDANEEKALVTQGKLEIVLHDGDPSITIKTGQGNQIVLSEKESSIVIEDQNKNRIVMEGSGVTIESAADLTLEAKGSVTIKGTDVEISAQGTAKVKGSGGVELTSSGTATVKGSMVQIN